MSLGPLSRDAWLLNSSETLTVCKTSLQLWDWWWEWRLFERNQVCSCGPTVCPLLSESRSLFFPPSSLNESRCSSVRKYLDSDTLDDLIQNIRIFYIFGCKSFAVNVLTEVYLDCMLLMIHQPPKSVLDLRRDFLHGRKNSEAIHCPPWSSRSFSVSELACGFFLFKNVPDCWDGLS